MCPSVVSPFSSLKILYSIHMLPCAVVILNYKAGDCGKALKIPLPLSALATVLVEKWMRLKLCGLLFKIIFEVFAVKLEIGLYLHP